MRWTEEEYQKYIKRVAKGEAGPPPPPPPARNVKGVIEIKKKKRSGKYNAKKVTVDCIKFDSKKEASYYEELKLRVAAGEVAYFMLQVPFHLPGGVVYKVDFQEFLTDGSVRYVDTKGFETPEFKIKKKQVEHLYPVTIEIV